MGERYSTVRDGSILLLAIWERCTDLVRREEQDIRTRRVHLVTLTGMDSLLLDGLNLEWFKFLIEYLTLKQPED